MYNASTYYTSIGFPQFILLQALHIAIGIFGIAGNVLVLLAYGKFGQVRALECSQLLAALAIGDLISGIGSLTLGISKLEIALFGYYDYTRVYCIVTSGILQIGLEISQIMIASIAVDRFMAMNSPFSYRKKDHSRFAKTAFGFALLAGAITVVLSVVDIDFSIAPHRCSWTGAVSTESNEIYLVFNALIGPTIAGIYALAMYKQRKFHRSLVGGHISDAYFTIQVKVTKILTILVVVYCILVAVPLTTLFFAITFKSVISSQITLAVISPLAYLGMSLNSSINVLIYVHSSSNLRPYIMQLLKCSRSSNERHSI